jgi:hypothetical protein
MQREFRRLMTVPGPADGIITAQVRILEEVGRGFQARSTIMARDEDCSSRPRKDGLPINFTL